MATVLTTPANSFNCVVGTMTANTDTITLTRLIAPCGVAIQLGGTWTGTVTFQASVDGTNFVTFNMTPAASGTDVSTATSTGAWSKEIFGYTAIRAACTASMTGTVNVTIRANQLLK